MIALYLTCDVSCTWPNCTKFYFTVLLYITIYLDYMMLSVGSCYYTAPEVLAGSYDYRCDTWSLVRTMSSITLRSCSFLLSHPTLSLSPWPLTVTLTTRPHSYLLLPPHRPSLIRNCSLRCCLSLSSYKSFSVLSATYCIHPPSFLIWFLLLICPE